MLANDPLAQRAVPSTCPGALSPSNSGPTCSRPGWAAAGAGIRLLEEECPPGADPLRPGQPDHPGGRPADRPLPAGLEDRGHVQVAAHRQPGREPCRRAQRGRHPHGRLRRHRHPGRQRHAGLPGRRRQTRCTSAMPARSGARAAPTPSARCSASGRRAQACAPSCASAGPASRGSPTPAVITETYRHFGRLGLGAVFGSKKLKGLVISGQRSLPVADRKAYRAVYDDLYKAATESPVMKKYHELGTAMNILPLNAHGRACPRATCSRDASKAPRRSAGKPWPRTTWAGGWPAPTARSPASTSRRCASPTPRSPTSTRPP